MLPGREAEPRREVACLPECLRLRGQDRYSLGDQRPNPRNGHQAPRHLVLFSAASDPGIELVDLRLQMNESTDQHLQRGNGIGGQAAVRVLDDHDQSRGVGCPLRHDLPELTQMVAKRIDRLRPLPDQQLVDPEHHGGPLGRFGLYGHKAHRRANGRFANRFSIGSVVLLWLPPLVQVASDLSWLVIECVLLSGLFECGRSRSRWPGW